MKPLEVIVEDNNIEKALAKLKKKMAYEGVLRELKKRRYHEKPSAKKKRKKEEAQRRLLKKQRRFASKMRNNRNRNKTK